MRGERPQERRGDEADGGSSPHARGTRLPRHDGHGLRRIIPACAGNADLTSCAIMLDPDHPRMRGERRPIPTSYAARFGSSPHARGTPWRPQPTPPPDRIIPACAGNAPRRRVIRTTAPDHPRMRGERQKKPVNGLHVAGSSPHARGTHPIPMGHGILCRIIPACAGNACAGSWGYD